MTKITATLLALVASVSLIAPTLTLAQSGGPSGLDTAIQWCAVANKAYKSGEQGRMAVAEQFTKMDDKTQTAMAVVCRSYVSGYNQGQKDLIEKMS